MLFNNSVARRKMSNVDNAWLRMDTAHNLMMIVGVAMLDRPVSTMDLKRELEKHFLVYHRFRSRVVCESSRAWWQEQAVDLDDHVIHTALPQQTQTRPQNQPNKAALQDLVGQLSGQPLNPEKPLWQMHLVDHCIGLDGRERQALIVRIHHCIADGVALVRLFMSMFDPAGAPGNASTEDSFAAEEDLPPPLSHELSHESIHEMPVIHHGDESWQQILDPVTHASINAIEASSAKLSKYLEALNETENIGDQVKQWGRKGVQLMHDLVEISTMGEDTPTCLKGPLNGQKRVAWSELLPLPEVKIMARAYGCSINDILMSTVAGALRQYMLQKGDEVAPDCEMRAMVPVNLRRANAPQELGNEFGLVPLVLPVGIEDPVERLQEVRQRMTELKHSYTALVALSMLGVLGGGPKLVQTETQDFFTRRATAVMSNVPGPTSPMYLAGSRLDQVMFWVPQSGSIGVGISILSYNGSVQFGIVTDAALADDPDKIISQFAPEFEKLVLLMLMDGAW